MNYDNAKRLVPAFQSLLGYYSETFEATVDLIFATLQDPILAKADLGQIKHGYRIPFIPADAGKFTIAVALSNGLLLSVKSFVQIEKIEHLQQTAEELDEMYRE